MSTTMMQNMTENNDNKSVMQMVFDFKNEMSEKGSDLSDKTIIKFAEQLSAKMDSTNKENSKDVIKLLKNLGFTVMVSKDLPDNVSGLIGINGEFFEKYGNTKIIVVSNKTKFGKQRFVIAHELAHFIFDFDDKKHNIFYNTYTNKETRTDNLESERKANLFAANLLMPSERVLEEFEKTNKLFYNDKVAELANLFDVTLNAMDLRLKELGLV